MGIEQIIAGRRARLRRQALVTVALIISVLIAFVMSLMFGNTFYRLSEVVKVLLGHEIPGASFTVSELRLPRATLGLLSGLCIGIAGVTFQTLLRNPLASPDVLGISFGASAGAVIGFVIYSLSETQVSLLALGGALSTAVTLHLIASRGGFSGARLILVGIGFAAMLQSVVTYVLSRAAEWEMQAAMQWLTGSVNGATWRRVIPLAVVGAIFASGLFVCGRSFGILRLGDDVATSLGLNVRYIRAAIMVSAVVLLAFATAASGPIAFVAFMSGPIAARMVSQGGSLTVPAGLVGALLVLVADLAGQNAFEHRYPVGVVTGVIGAPFLILLLIRTNRSGGSL